MFYVYKYTDPRNDEIFYIGKGVGNRMYDHLEEALSDKRHPKLQKIRKIWSLGLAPIIEKVEEFYDEDEAYQYEKMLIEKIGSCFIPTIKNGSLTNLKEGGKGGGCSWIWDTEKRDVMSTKMKGLNLGDKNGMFGKEPRNKGKKVSIEVLTKMGKKVYQFSLEGELLQEFPYMRKASLDVGISEPTLRKSALSSGKTKGGNYRWSFTNTLLNDLVLSTKMGSHPNSRNNLDGRTRPVYQYDLDGNFIAEFGSVTEATNKTKTSNISLVLCGKAKQAGGYKWEYKTK